MSSSLGRRYERLLLFAGPLSFAAVVVAFVAVSVPASVDRQARECFVKARDAFVAKTPELERSWSRRPAQVGYSQLGFARWRDDYYSQVRQTRLYSSIGDNCQKSLAFLEDPIDPLSPAMIIKALTTQATALTERPLFLYGIEIPDPATINIFGTPIRVPLLLFAQALHMILAPLLMLWLASLNNTRFVETISIGRAKSPLEIFPHVLNVYPVGQQPRFRKRKVLAGLSLNAAFYFAAFIRMTLVALIVGPSVTAFVFGIYVLYPLSSTTLEVPTLLIVNLVSAMGVLTFTASNLLIEFSPWHARKMFPPAVDPRLKAESE